MDLKDIHIPSWDELFIKAAYLIASKSKDQSTQIGSVIVKDRNILSVGYNDFPRGIDDSIEERRYRPLKLLFTAHSEFNSVVDCARKGMSCLGATLYSFGYPCAGCMQAILQGGITEIVMHKEWADQAEQFYQDRWSDSRKAAEVMAEEAGLAIRYFSGFVNYSVLLSGKYLTF